MHFYNIKIGLLISCNRPALLAGFSFQEIGVFFDFGIAKVMSIAVMFIFAILYFGLMQDV